MRRRDLRGTAVGPIGAAYGRLTRKPTALVTGATAGIGAAFARRLMR